MSAMGGATTRVRSARRQFIAKMIATPPTRVRSCPTTERIVLVTTWWTTDASEVTCEMSSPLLRSWKKESESECRWRAIDTRRS